MKKIFFSLMAVAVLASCAKTDEVNTQAEEIALSPVTSLVTKASIDGVEYPAAEHFTVVGYWADEVAGSTFTDGSTYLNYVEFAKRENSKYWGGYNTSYYWPKNGSLRFACYSPAEVNATSVAHAQVVKAEAETEEDLVDVWTATGYTQSDKTDSTTDFMVTETTKSYTSSTAGVPVLFEHALSWITIQVVAEDAVAAKAFTINNITINRVNTVADMVAVMSGEESSIEWSNWSADKPYQVFATSDDVAPVDLTTKAQVIENTERGTVVIPQATTSVTVRFTQNALTHVEEDGTVVVDTPELTNQSITASLAIDKDLTPWEAGKHYIYTIVFGIDEILIDPSVQDWKDVIVANI